MTLLNISFSKWNISHMQPSATLDLNIRPEILNVSELVTSMLTMHDNAMQHKMICPIVLQGTRGDKHAHNVVSKTMKFEAIFSSFITVILRSSAFLRL